MKFNIKMYRVKETRNNITNKLFMHETNKGMVDNTKVKKWPPMTTKLVQQLPLDVWMRAWMKTMMGLSEIQNLFLLSFHLMGVSLAHSQLWVNWHPTRQPNYSSVFTITVTSTDDCCLSPLGRGTCTRPCCSEL